MQETILRGGRAGIAIAALGLAFAGGACGGEPHPEAKAPEAPPPVSSVARRAATPGQKVGITAGAAGGAELSGDAKSTYDRGFQAWMSGDLQAAKTAFSNAAQKAPAAGGPRYSLGCVLERLGDTQGALDAYRAAYTASSKFEVAMGAYALLLAQSGHGTDAEQFLSDKLAQNPNSPALMTYKAEVKSIEGDSPGCQQVAQQALAKQPNFKDAMVVIARDYYRNHRWDLARYALQAILDGADDGSIPPRDKGNAESLLLRGLIEREQGQRKQALVDFDQAIQSRPDLFEAYVNLGEMKLEAGNAAEAQTPLENAVRYAPNVPVAHLDLGDCYRLLGRPGDAKSELDRAMAMDSTLAGVHYDLGLLYLFSPSVPGAASQDDQLTKAIRELETYKSMRGAKTPKGPGDDVDELLSTAKRKQSELQLKKQSAAPAPPPAADTAPPPPSVAPVAAPAKAAAPVKPVAPTKPGTPAKAVVPAPAKPGRTPAPAKSVAPAKSPAPSGGGNIVRDLPN
ncbi:MAG: tetratricopeptide repeat protein [Polyangiaceae bacterium]